MIELIALAVVELAALIAILLIATRSTGPHEKGAAGSGKLTD
jgi:hypothetical protein